MDINFPPPILAKKTFFVTVLLAVGFVAVSYTFAISEDLEDEQPDRAAEGADRHHAQGSGSEEAGHGQALGKGPPSHEPSNADLAAEDHSGHDHGSHQELRHD